MRASRAPGFLAKGILALPLVVGSALARGPEESPPTLTRVTREIVVEGVLPRSSTALGGSPVPLVRAPASIDVVARPTLAARDATGLGDALADTAGAAVHSGFGVFDFFSVRGVDSLTGSLLLNGSAAEPEASVYPLYNVERVEVLRGPAAFRWGGNALASAVNLVREAPDPSGSRGRLRAGFGSDATWRGEADLNLAGDGQPFAARFNAWWQESDGNRGHDGRVLAVNPTLSWRPSPSSSLSLDLEWLASDVRPDAGLPVEGERLAAAAADADFGSEHDFSEQRLGRVRAAWRTEINERWTLSDELYFTRLDWRTDGTLLVGVLPLPSGELVARTLLRLDDRQDFAGNRFEAELVASRHHLVLGLEADRLADTFTLDTFLLPPAPVGDPESSPSAPLVPLPGQAQRGDGRSLVLAPYVVDRVRLASSLELWLGARLDHIDHEDRATATDREVTELSPLLGVVYAPRPEVSVYLNAGRAFAPPSSRVRGEREPESSRQVEAGLKGTALSGRVQGALAVYQLERRDIAIPGDDGVTRETGDQRAKGVELSVHGHGLDGLEGFVQWAYTDAVLTDFRETVATGFLPGDVAVVDRSGNRVAFTPRHIVRAFAGGRRGSGIARGLGAWGGMRWVGDQFIAEDNAFVIDDVVTFDLTLSYLRAGVEARLHLENLTGRDYLTRGFAATSVIPGPGRAAHFSVFLPLWRERQRS